VHWPSRRRIFLRRQWLNPQTPLQVRFHALVLRVNAKISVTQFS
jgi:hypothetical protein